MHPKSIAVIATCLALAGCSGLSSERTTPTDGVDRPPIGTKPPPTTTPTTTPTNPPPPPGSDVARYDVYEITIAHPSGGYANPWEEVSVQAEFVAPSGASFSVDGFHYDVDTWKVRFAPDEAGTYSYRYTLRDGSGPRTEDAGDFRVGEAGRRGFLRRHPSNPFRFVYEADGGLFSGQGLQTCVRDTLAEAFPTPEDRKGWCIDKYQSSDTCLRNADQWLDTYVGETEVTLFRWSVNNCSFPLWVQVHTDPSGQPANVYDARLGQWGDAYVQKLRARGVRIYMDPIGFGWQRPEPGRVSCGPNADQDCSLDVCGLQANLPCTDKNAAGINTNDLDAIERYYRYIVARYGAYVDFWELINEFPLPDESIARLKRFVRGIDPYGHPISTSWARPDHPDIEMNSPHLFEQSNVLDIDVRTVDALVRGSGQSWSAKATHGKPIIVGEMGEPFRDRTGEPDYLLQTRHGIRIKAWTGFFNEIGTIFWESSLSAAQWLGGIVFYSPQVRSDARAHSRFVATVTADVRPGAAMTLSHSGETVRRYDLDGEQTRYVYLVHAVRDVNSPRSVEGLQMQLDLPVASTVEWYATESGATLGTSSLDAGTHNLDVPPFTFDIALRTTPR